MTVSYAGEYGPEGIEYPDGRHAVNVLVTVVQDDGSPAILYVDKERSAIRANPIRTDSLGNLWFFANPGSYRLIFPTFELPIVVAAHPLSDSAGGASLGYHHIQGFASELWEIPHSFGYRPNVTVKDNSSPPVLTEPADITHSSDLLKTFIHFPGLPMSGTADAS